MPPWPIYISSKGLPPYVTTAHIVSATISSATTPNITDYLSRNIEAAITHGGAPLVSPMLSRSQLNISMKDLRDLMSMIEESQNAFDDTQPYFDGVWDSFKKIHNLSVPDAVMAPSAETLRAERRRRSMNASKVKEEFVKSSEDDTALIRQGEDGGNSGGPESSNSNSSD